MSGKWIDKVHECNPYAVDTDDVARMSIWECKCGQQWQFGGYDRYGEKWWRYPVTSTRKVRSPIRVTISSYSIHDRGCHADPCVCRDAS